LCFHQSRCLSHLQHSQQVQSVMLSDSFRCVPVKRLCCDGRATGLAFLVPDGYNDGNPPLPKFLVFFDDISDSIAAANYLRGRLPHSLKDKIKWFNADMSVTFKEAEFANLTIGKTWGFCTTASFGMVRPESDISRDSAATCREGIL